MKLILASASPRRAEILRNAGVPFEVSAAFLDESRHPSESPGDYVRRLAHAKARVAADAWPDSGDSIFLGADTIVVAAGAVLGKPATQDESRRMLQILSGAVHEVHTGLALLRRADAMERVIEEVTRVTFAQLSDAEIEFYLATGEPFDKAGAYGIQGRGGRFVTRIEGCYFNVMGLPLAKLWSLLRDFGWKESAI
jgi:septum formation protein